MEKYYLAIDIGASSGRHIIGHFDGKEIVTDEVYRFSNGVKEQDGHLIWDLENLFSEIVNGIAVSLEKYPKIESLAIDTWGVDYALIKDGTPLLPVYAYRDSRTEKSIPEVHKITPPEYLFERTGIAFQTYNTIYQLYEDKMAGRLDGVTDFLLMPELLNYMLTGNIKKEYTNGTTTGLVNADTKEFDAEIISKLGLPSHLFPTLYEGGTLVGDLKPEIQKRVKGNVPVKLCLSHDTASAFYTAGILGGDSSVYISSGTWSLLGNKQTGKHTDEKVRLHGFTNEGGIGKTFRLLKNIMGMWVINNVCKENGITPKDVAGLAEKSSYSHTVNVNHNDFFAPDSMTETFKSRLKASGAPELKDVKDLSRCALLSLAKAYAESVFELEKDVNKTYDNIVIVGGGAKNQTLNKLTEQFSGKKVIAMPIEATAIGNLRIQMEN
ncbi:MAG: rhamnulokinase [Clostridia bacterium]|nr:rhamnulokinase [Clostridia bacterium]